MQADNCPVIIKQLAKSNFQFFKWLDLNRLSFLTDDSTKRGETVNETVLYTENDELFAKNVHNIQQIFTTNNGRKILISL